MTKLRAALFATLPLSAAIGLWLARQTPAASAASPELARTAVIVAPGTVEPARDPEVAHARGAGGVEQDVRGFEVAMQHMPLVCKVHRLSDGLRQFRRAARAQTLALLGRQGDDAGC